MRVRPQLEAVQCQLDLLIEPAIVGSWDRYRIEQVLDNLLSNAIRYCAGKPVHVAAYRAGGNAMLVVSDKGRGVSPENQERIFRRFERVDSDYATGLGLGLYICREIVEAHKGSIRVESMVGQGSKFIVALPLAKTESPLGEAPSALSIGR